MQSDEIVLSSFLLRKLYKNLSYKSIVNIPYNGWDDLISNLHRKLDLLDSEYKISSITETGGQLDIVLSEKKYPKAVEEAMHRYINQAVIESNTICICCGDSKFAMKLEENVFLFCKNCKLREDFKVSLPV